MKPVGDYIFIEKEPLKETTESGIYIPDADQLQKVGAAKGTITEVGPSITEFKKGTKVIFNEHQYDHLLKNKETGCDVLVGKPAGIYATYA